MMTGKTLSKNANTEPKHGLAYAEAMAEGMKIAERAARRYRKWHKCSADHADILSAAYEAVCKAWAAWPGPAVASWSYSAFMYADTYARRESNKRKSVVVTNVSRCSLRKVERDEGVFVTSDDGETSEERFASATVAADLLLEQRDTLKAVMVALDAAIPHCAPSREALARDVIVRRILTDAPESAATLAAKHKVTSSYVYNIEKALRAAVGE